MRTRTFGRIGWPVSEIGLGTWAMGGMWGPLDDRESIRAIQRALDLGVDFIDTAFVYGDGHAEDVIAKALRGRDDSVRIASKVPPKNMIWPARHDTPVREAFPHKWIVQCTERSLRRLKRDTLDLQQFHVWGTR